MGNGSPPGAHVALLLPHFLSSSGETRVTYLPATSWDRHLHNYLTFPSGPLAVQWPATASLVLPAVVPYPASGLPRDTYGAVEDSVSQVDASEGLLATSPAVSLRREQSQKCALTGPFLRSRPATRIHRGPGSPQT